MVNVKLVLGGEVIAESTSISAEVSKDVQAIGSTENKGVTYQEACELIAKYLKEVHGKEITGEQVFNASPTGELFHVFFLYKKAKAYYNAVETIDKWLEEGKGK